MRHKQKEGGINHPFILRGENMEELSGWLGRYHIIVTDKNGHKERYCIDNRITNVGLNLVRDAWNGDVSDIEIKYLALGTSNAPLTNSDTQLGAEGFRTGFISTSKPATGQLQKTALVLDNEAVFNIREIGIFAGSGATGTANSGILLSRILWSRDKTELESIQFVRTDTIQRG